MARNGSKATVRRRYSSIKGHVTFFLALAGASAALHFLPWNGYLTERIRLFDWISVSLMLVIYLGYKLGRLAGFLAGLLSTLPWLIAYLCLVDSGTAQAALTGYASSDFILGINHATITAFSLQYVVLFAACGFGTGLLFDRLDATLTEHRATFDELIPVRQRAFLGSIAARFEAAFALPKTIGERGSVLSSSRRSKWKVLLHVPLAVALVCMNFMVVIFSKEFQLHLFPALLAAAGTLAYAYVTSANLGVMMAFVVWSGSYILMIPLANIALPTLDQGLRLSIAPSLSTVGQVVGLAVLAWWFGQFGEVMRDSQKRTQLKSSVTGYLRESQSNVAPSYALVMALLVCLITVRLGAQSGGIAVHLLVVSFIIFAAWAHRRNAFSVSNRTLVVAALMSLGTASWSKGTFHVGTLSLDIGDVLLLSSLPLVAGRLKLSSLAICRFLAFGFLLARVTLSLYLSGEVIGGTSIGVTYRSFDLLIVSCALTLLLYELGARALHRLCM